MNKINVNERYSMYSTFSAFEKVLYYSQIYAFLKRLNIEYPGFSKWYKGLFLKNKELQDGREIIICEREYCIAGIAILKSTEEEKNLYLTCSCSISAARDRQKVNGNEL